MPEKLYEAEFQSVDIKSLFSNNQTSSKNSTQQPRPANFDWGAELKNRLEQNRSMSASERGSEYNIETEFFTEFFNTFCKGDQDLARQLMSLGEPLRKAFRVLGFKKQSNPIMAFISLDYVQNKLIKTHLVNVSTFKAIFNAVANKLVADSEFSAVHDFNIIYCQDLYKKPLKEIEEYLKLQSKMLNVSASTYTVDDQVKNKKVFFYIPSIKELNAEKRATAIAALDSSVKLPSAKSSTTKLNSLELALTISGKKLEDPGNNKTQIKSNEQTSIASKLTKASEVFAAIQYLSVNTASRRALAALNDAKFKELSANDILTATAKLASQNIIPKGAISGNDADDLVDILLKRLQEIKQ